MKFPLTIIFLLITSLLFAQQNLVPNPSFEDSLGCPNGSSQLYKTTYWQEGYGSVDYFRSCGTNGYSIPINKCGGEAAHSGTAYIGIASFAVGVHNGREFVEVELIDSLIANKNYIVEFYLSLADSMQYTIWNIGAYISTNGVYGNALSQILAYVPQVTNSPGNYITNKTGWTEIRDTFISTGGEKFITIGNFDDDSVIDTLYVGGSSNSGPYDWSEAYYYLDDVSVYEDTTVGLNENILNYNSINIFPNPTTNELTLDFTLIDKYFFELYNVIGAKRMAVTLDSGSQTKIIDLTDIDNGVYFYSVVDRNDNRIKTGKLIIIK